LKIVNNGADAVNSSGPTFDTKHGVSIFAYTSIKITYHVRYVLELTLVLPDVVHQFVPAVQHAGDVLEEDPPVVFRGDHVRRLWGWDQVPNLYLGAAPGVNAVALICHSVRDNRVVQTGECGLDVLDHDRAQAARRRLVARWNISGVGGRGEVGGLVALPTPAADFSVVDESRLSGCGVAAEADVQTFAGAGDLHDGYPGLCTLNGACEQNMTSVSLPIRK
jgi:hypothetical protein|tara:strand:- start:300 stop:962 length:663 start_codon:yes stop_codon:yes gene_type:complete